MSRVIVMDLSRHNTLLVGHDRYFVLRSDGRSLLVHDHCPHRGGPLSLARRTPDERRLICPWHGTRVGVAAVRRTCLPMVRSGNEAVVVLPDDNNAPVSVIHREILANLPPDAPTTTAPPCTPPPTHPDTAAAPDAAGRPDAAARPQGAAQADAVRPEDAAQAGDAAGAEGGAGR